MKIRLFILSAIMLCSQIVFAQKTKQVDICIYGSTSAGIISAYTASKQGKTVLLIEPTNHLGGLTTGGLGKTDIGKVEVIQGLSMDFYRRVGKMYGQEEPVFKFEPRIASAVYDEYIQEAQLNILKNHRIISASKKKNTVRSITLEDTQKGGVVIVKAKIFIDCSYEGDLMARCGISYTTGREPNNQYGETWNGVQLSIFHQFPDGVDPYVVKGDPSSGLLYGILPSEMGKIGDGDKHIQAYNFRITLTMDSANMIPITKPENYDPSHYELLLRVAEMSDWTILNNLFIWDLMPNNKTDVNNRGAFSTDMIGANWDYPEADYATRERIYKEHLDYTKGLLYFVGHDKRMPAIIRKRMSEWGYPKDEFVNNGHFTPQLYIREARRMIGPYIMTDKNCMQDVFIQDTIAWGAYNMDSHNSGRYVVNGMVKNEGDVEIRLTKGPYAISYRSITPFENEARNVLVPVCLSASHIAYGSIRMEPVFMVLGQTAALAACQALDKHKGTVQKVDAKQVMEMFYAH